MKTLITGANGFIGKNLVSSFAATDKLRLLVRKTSGDVREVTGDILDKPSLNRACQGIDTVFHCAGYAHAFNVPQQQEERHHQKINFEGTCYIANAAAQAGVKRFVFLSSIKAMGEPEENCVDETFDKLPETTYGRAKRKAESALQEIGSKTGMEIICLRLTMVYGSGGHGNLDRMAALIRKGLFPPLPEVQNKRSLVHISDVVRALRLVGEDSRAAGKTYIVADSKNYSGRQIYNALREAMNMKPVRWSIPASILKIGACTGDIVQKITGHRVPLDGQALDRLLGSACYSPALIEKELGWRAQTSLVQGLKYLTKEN